MKLFAQLYAAEADQAERGVLRDDHVWVDTLPAEPPADGTVWVAIEMPDNRVHRFERRDEPHPDRREFLLPSRLTNLQRPRRVDPDSW